MEILYTRNISPTKYFVGQKKDNSIYSQKCCDSYGNLDCLSLSPAIAFCGRVEPTSYLKSTYKKVKNFYSEYKNSFGEVSYKDIERMADNVVNNSGHSREDVLGVMQKLTQFSNMQSVNIITEMLKKRNVTEIASCSRYLEDSSKILLNPVNREVNLMQDSVGIHRTFTYLLESKKRIFLPITKRKKFAYFLDSDNVSVLEKMKMNDIDEFNKIKSNPNIEFFFLSGWDNGINFLDRTKNLESETMRVLKYSEKVGVSPEQAVNYQMKKRIKALGLSPIIISREGMPKEQCIYNQMASEKMTEQDFFNLIDANSQYRGKNVLQRTRIKDDSINYLSEQMKIYTPEIMSEKIKEMHKMIVEKAEKRGYYPEDILYVEPEPIRSNTLINNMYKKINRIPDEKFISISDAMQKKTDFKDKFIVFVDDCTITGESLDGAVETSRVIFDKKQPKLFACICGTEGAVLKFPRKYNSEILVIDMLRSVPTSKNSVCSSRLRETVGNPDYMKGEATCLIFPYMSPDNNTELASNIALFHTKSFRGYNSVFRTEKSDNSPQSDYNSFQSFYRAKIITKGCIKNYTNVVFDVSKMADSMIGSSAKITDMNYSDMQRLYPRKWTDYLKFKTYKEMFENIFFPKID